jgi:hypothetical protein
MTDKATIAAKDAAITRDMMTPELLKRFRGSEVKADLMEELASLG